MELDDFKKLKVRTPELVSTGEKTDSGSPASVIEAFRAEEEKNRKMLIIMATVLIAMSVIYFSKLSAKEIIYATGMMIIGVGFLMGALYIFISARKLPDSIYTLPLIDFLKVAETRLRYLPLRDILKIAPILITLGIGGGMALTGSLMKYNVNITVVASIWTLFFISLCIFGYFAGKKSWKKNYGNLLSMIEKARKDLRS